MYVNAALELCNIPWAIQRFISGRKHEAYMVRTRRIQVVTLSGKTLITDPTRPSGRLTYSPVNAGADRVTVSHGHRDHGSVDEVSGTPVIVKNPGPADVKDVHIEGIPPFHDKTPVLLMESAR